MAKRERLSTWLVRFHSIGPSDCYQTSFHPDLQASFERLKAAIANGQLPWNMCKSINPLSESWEAKGKFPPSIKPLLATIALQAIKLDEYDEHFFNLMPTLFPYNKFTMTVSPLPALVCVD